MATHDDARTALDSVATTRHDTLRRGSPTATWHAIGALTLAVAAAKVVSSAAGVALQLCAAVAFAVLLGAAARHSGVRRVHLGAGRTLALAGAVLAVLLPAIVVTAGIANTLELPWVWVVGGVVQWGLLVAVGARVEARLLAATARS